MTAVGVGRVERSGVAAVSYLAGYLGEPRQSRMFNAVGRHDTGRCRE